MADRKTVSARKAELEKMTDEDIAVCAAVEHGYKVGYGDDNREGRVRWILDDELKNGTIFADDAANANAGAGGTTPPVPPRGARRLDIRPDHQRALPEGNGGGAGHDERPRTEVQPEPDDHRPNRRLGAFVAAFAIVVTLAFGWWAFSDDKPVNPPRPAITKIEVMPAAPAATATPSVSDPAIPAVTPTPVDPAATATPTPALAAPSATAAVPKVYPTYANLEPGDKDCVNEFRAGRVPVGGVIDQRVIPACYDASHRAR